MNTSDYLSRPKRSEASALADMDDQRMLEFLIAEVDRLERLIDVVADNAGHEKTREAATWAVGGLCDTSDYLEDAFKLWKEDPQGMADEIEADRLSHDKDVAADLRKGE